MVKERRDTAILFGIAVQTLLVAFASGILIWLILFFGFPEGPLRQLVDFMMTNPTQSPETYGTVNKLLNMLQPYDQMVTYIVMLVTGLYTGYKCSTLRRSSVYKQAGIVGLCIMLLESSFIIAMAPGHFASFTKTALLVQVVCIVLGVITSVFGSEFGIRVTPFIKNITSSDAESI